MAIPKLPKLFEPSGHAANLSSKIYEWISGAQDVLRELRQFVEKTDFFNALRIAGMEVQKTKPTDGQVLTVANGSTKVKWEDASGGDVDSVFGRTGVVVAVAGDYDSDEVDNASGVAGATVSDALDQLDTDIGGLGSDDIANDSTVTGTTVSDALDTLAANVVKSHFRARVTAGYDWTSTSWTGVHAALTFIDEEALDISRSNSDFTFTHTGRYQFTFSVWVTSSGTQVTGWRLYRAADTTVLASQDAVTTNVGQQVFMAMVWTVDVTAGDVLSLQYAVVAASAGSWAAHTIDGLVMNTANLYIQKVE